MEENIIKNPWAALRDYTDARIGLGRTGVSLPTSKLLEFQLAHAMARDAVHLPLNIDNLLDGFANMPLELELLEKEATKGVLKEGIIPLLLHSQAVNRHVYLQRPDLGRRLNKESRKKLEELPKLDSYDLAIVIVDGLSSIAIKENAINFIHKLSKELVNDSLDWTLAPFSIVEQGRVAIGDEVGNLLNAKAVLVLIGERPGLSSPDSLGLYLTYNPKVGLNDSNRNCISNIRTDGLSYEEATKKALYLLKESRRLELSGVQIKDRTEDNETIQIKQEKNFLLN
ncbi:ethanolamine ammonia-lyase [Halarcobacter ebronensis]|uniref:Ethanolamine ammonia-lyase small subunit n=1 Tax=Halarcobacter ebronensis TaxID=1462615 RepID=A0A4Q0YA63_9BACT|nr:ethanolamine ammonia-lyase subunit EutC [Halarcobacter ebronensis]RXJ66394.1 ethanolamine ammonia-lyase [Halarcobacter ebronensis]